ncbi:MAG: hypothetical protein AAGH99_05185 [Planctomycetota bacterium]
MSKSEKNFERWVSPEFYSWTYQIFKGHDSELAKIWSSHQTAFKYVFRQLGETSVRPEDSLTAVFDKPQLDQYRIATVDDWVSSYNQFDYWVNLTAALTIASNLETYLASAINLAIDSDPGLLVGDSRSIDGAKIIKRKHKIYFSTSNILESCTRGSWSTRLDAIEKILHDAVTPLRSIHSDLDELRVTRNKFGHAFGRDIKQARKIGTLDILPMQKLKTKKVNNWRNKIINAVKVFDRKILERHIGDFDAVALYGRLYRNWPTHVPVEQRAIYFKAAIAQHGAALRGKKYCKQLARYWEGL